MAKKRSNREELEQVALMEWVDFVSMNPECDCPEIDLMYHTPSGMPASKRTAARFKRMGMKPHVPDLHLPVSRGGFHGLWIEMKVFPSCDKKLQGYKCSEPVNLIERLEESSMGKALGRCTVCRGETTRTVSTFCDPGQVTMIEDLRREGHRVEVCMGWVEAAELLSEYLGLPDSALRFVA